MRITLDLSEEQIEALHLECLAAMRAFDDERAQELFSMTQDESADAADPMNA